MTDHDGGMEFNAMLLRLERRLREIDMLPSEVVGLIGRELAIWPIPVHLRWSPISRRIETRLRWLLETCELLDAVHGVDAPMHLRGASTDIGLTPLDHLSDDSDALPSFLGSLRIMCGRDGHRDDREATR